jgi:hypothetical protein
VSDPDDKRSSGQRKALVGYGRPPTDHQFRKGTSGNPRGRPKKSPRPSKAADGDTRLADLVMQEAYRQIQIRENGKLEELPMIQAVLRSLGVAAVKGSHRAQLAITSLVQAVEQRTLNERQAMFEAGIEYKRGWEEIFELCDSRGEPRPEPVPHPDDILIDARAGVVIFNGPVDDNQKAAWDQALERRTASLHEIEEYKRDIENEPELRRVYEDEIAHEQRLADLIGSRIPDEQTRRVPGFNIYEWREKQGKDKERRERLRQIRDSGSA